MEWKQLKPIVKDVSRQLVEYGCELYENGEDREEIEYLVRQELVQSHTDSIHEISDKYEEDGWDWEFVKDKIVEDVMDWIDDYIDDEVED